MYKAFIIVSLLAILVLSKADDEKYSTKYDNVDLDSILDNNRLLDNYVKCLKDEGPCTPDGQELRDVLPVALQNKCSKCNEKQKDGTRKVIRFLAANKKEAWADLKKKYDPEGKYEKDIKDIID